ncbi:hypothetical protein [Hymenobacter edaphi]|uniref:Uncharacterized protein n=1 Tax=Hymenobacter edaphi TaxID=2211146 RepID=A0A328BE78_9BACT|nr:hypothetical protein [Hymenobacter edaphi]RAK64176.1 hypothetical protein DLM85_19790 [Hymenobacter edaphi]
MARPAALRPAVKPKPGPALRPMETYYPTIETRVHVAATEAGLALFYEAGGRLQTEGLRFGVSHAAADRRVLTIEIEYSQDLRCPSEL